MTRVQKRIRALMIIICIIAASVILCGGRKARMQAEEYVISQGDTLWSIASEYKPSGMRYDDYIYLLKQANDIDSSIAAGQTIMVFTEE